MKKERMWLSGCILAAGSVMALGSSGCNSNPPSDQQVQQQAAQATAEARQAAKQAVADTKVAAADAEREVNDVAAGVKQGIHEDAPLVDLNSASQIRLATLPGVSLDQAKQIVDKRPYTSTHQLVSRGILSHAEYEKIAGEITVGK